jgi:hypothetical protein
MSSFFGNYRSLVSAETHVKRALVCHRAGEVMPSALEGQRLNDPAPIVSQGVV